MNNYKNYVGCKIIKSKKATFEEYLKVKYGNDYDCNSYTGSMKLSDLVYIVIYPPIGKNEKPYVSLSPVKVFEFCYRKFAEEEIKILLNENPLDERFNK